MGSGANLYGQGSVRAQATVAPLSGLTSFPAIALGVKVELMLNATWTDITAYVYLRDPTVITGMGRADETGTIQPAQLTMTLDNRGGRFTPKNPISPYYPYILRNVQIRVSVSSKSSTGVSYSGRRFTGEVTSWPSAWDPSGHDVFAQITASGPWRRVSQATATLGSPMKRFMKNLSGSSVPQAYWPMEDGNGSLTFVPLIPGNGPNGTWTPANPSTPSLSSSSVFPGSDALAAFNGEAITFNVPSGGTPTNNFVRFAFSVPAAGDSAQGNTNWNVAHITTNGTIAYMDLMLNPNGTLFLGGYDIGNDQLFGATTSTNVKGMPLLISVELTPSGGNVAWKFRLIQPGGAAVLESATGTVSIATIGAVTTVLLGRANVLTDTVVGHLAVMYQAVPSMPSAAYALNGYIGEYAMDRFTRLCTEQGMSYETIGAATTTAKMGPQIDDTLANLLQMAESTDLGLLYEARDNLAIGYRAKASIVGQAVTVALNYAGKQIQQGLQSTYDDQLSRNDVTITNWDSYAVEAVLNSGAMSVQNPPSGIGTGYAFAGNCSTATDSQVAGIADFVLGVGSVDEPRYPQITVEMARPEMASLFSALPSVRIGDYLQITSPPSFQTASTVNQLFWGYTETLAPQQWTFVFNCVPQTPWQNGYSPGGVTTTQVSGSAPSSFGQSDATSLATLIGNNGLIGWNALTSTITSVSPTGLKVTLAGSAPASPNTGDIWINNSTGLMQQWNGTAWVPITFNAHDTIQAGTVTAAEIAASTITASQIAGGTITAANLQAGIEVAGIVDASTINAATITGGTITANSSIILDEVATPSPAVHHSAQLYTQLSTGMPSYVTDSGLWMTMCGAQTSWNPNNTIVGVGEGNLASWTIPAGDADPQAIYETEVWGTGVMGSSTQNTLQYFAVLGGTNMASVTIGALMFPLGQVFRFHIIARAFAVTIGSSATWRSLIHGETSAFNNTLLGGSGANGSMGFTSSESTSLFTVNSTVAIDLGLSAQWGGVANGSQGVTSRLAIAKRIC